MRRRRAGAPLYRRRLSGRSPAVSLEFGLPCARALECGMGLRVCLLNYRAGCGPASSGRPCSDDVECGIGNVCQTSADVTDAGSGAGSRICTWATYCAQDADCGDGRVCRSFAPFVPAAEQTAAGWVCRAPCTTDPDCAPTDKCDGAGHCQPRTCAECPSYYSCVTGTCVVTSCSADKDCPGGFCVNGVCDGALGICQPICS